jgi:hypothetical protein
MREEKMFMIVEFPIFLIDLWIPVMNIQFARKRMRNP